MLISNPIHRCGKCGATSYRRVVARDEHGSMRATDQYLCSGCALVFADPKSWREGDAMELQPATRHASGRTFTVMTAVAQTAAPAAMNRKAPDAFAFGLQSTE